MITRHQERKMRIMLATDEMVRPFQDFLQLKIPTSVLKHNTGKIKKHCNNNEWKLLQTLEYQNFDISLLYKIFRNLCDEIGLDGPTTKWEDNSMPDKTHRTPCDDIKRASFIRNKYYHKIKKKQEMEITETELEEVKTEYIEICQRMQGHTSERFKDVSYVAQIQEVFSCDVDRIEDIEKRLKRLEQGRKRKADEGTGNFTYPNNRKRRKIICKALEKLNEILVWKEKSKVVLIVGEYGAGKSSFINSVLTAINGQYCEYCEVAQTSIGSNKTTVLKVLGPDKYLRSREPPSELYPTFVDMIGIDQNDTASLDDLLPCIIDGKVKANILLTDFRRGSTKIIDLQNQPKGQGPIVDLMVFVWAPKKGKSPAKILETIKKAAIDETREIPITVVLTKMDECNLNEEELTNLKTSVCNVLKINPEKILECVNCSRVSGWSKGSEEDILKFLQIICDPFLERSETIRMKCKSQEMSKSAYFVRVAIFIIILSLLFCAILYLLRPTRLIYYNRTSDVPEKSLKL